MKKKSVDVQKFGGVEDLGGFTERDAIGAPVKDVNYDVKSFEAESKTKLEDDRGEGAAAILRCFKFGMNPEAFRQYSPTKQELFNSHYKGIELALWKDGLKVVPEVHPRIIVNEQTMSYEIWVTAKPNRGNFLPYDLNPQTLSQIAHG